MFRLLYQTDVYLYLPLFIYIDILIFLLQKMHYKHNFIHVSMYIKIADFCLLVYIESVQITKKKFPTFYRTCCTINKKAILEHVISYSNDSLMINQSSIL